MIVSFTLGFVEDEHLLSASTIWHLDQLCPEADNELGNQYGMDVEYPDQLLAKRDRK
jgi:hypothetical protein